MQLNHETFQSKSFMFYSYLILLETLEKYAASLPEIESYLIPEIEEGRASQNTSYDS